MRNEDNNTMININAMKITQEKYNKLRDMNLINRAKYNLNDRAEMIIQEV